MVINLIGDRLLHTGMVIWSVRMPCSRIFIKPLYTAFATGAIKPTHLARATSFRNILTPAAPSAELRDNQTDQDSSPPYEVLDDILHRYIEQRLVVRSIVAAGHDEAVVNVWRVWCINEDKTQQGALLAAHHRRWRCKRLAGADYEPVQRITSRPCTIEKTATDEWTMRRFFTD